MRIKLKQFELVRNNQIQYTINIELYEVIINIKKEKNIQKRITKLL
jgi:hypothetical protein